MSVPYVGFTNDQMDRMPKLGPTASCPKCGKECKVKESEPPFLQFISCCGSEYLVGIEGREVPRDSFCSGKVHLSGGSKP